MAEPDEWDWDFEEDGKDSQAAAAPGGGLQQQEEDEDLAAQDQDLVAPEEPDGAVPEDEDLAYDWDFGSQEGAAREEPAADEAGFEEVDVEEEEEDEDTPRSWEDIDEAAEASAGAEEEGEDDGDQATKVFAEAGKGNVLFEADGGESVPVLLEADGAQEHTSRTKHDDDEAPEALPEAKEKNAKMDVKGAEDGNGDRPDDEEEQEEEEEEEAPLPGTSYPNTPAWRSPWSTASVKEEGKDEEEHGAGAPKQHDRQEKHGEAQKKHEKERHEDPPPPGCDADDHLPEMWAHQGGKEAVFKVLTYNLFWWSLFGERDGDHDKAAHLIEKAAKSRAFDLMGFQECEDVARVLEPAGLKDTYYVFSGSGKTEAICIAASKASFDLLSHGMQAVGEDSKEQYFGKRSAQWMRLNHKKTGQKVFFMNHHGPLPVDSGGKCGGRATARALLQLTSAEAERGDAVIMVGDFNAGDGSTTVESLEKRLHRVYHGVADGGIDNFFSNLGTDSVRKAENLGSGGSDHDALSVELQVGGGVGEAPPPGEDEEADGEDELPPARPEGEGQTGGEAAPEAAAEGEGPEDEKDDRPSRCGLSDEGGVAYSGLAGEEVDGVGSPADCCTTCSGSSTCKSWTWTGRSGAGVCSLWFGLPAQREKKEGFISGLPPRKARLDFKRS